MTATVQELVEDWRRPSRAGYEEHARRTWEVSGDTLTDIYRKTYPEHRSLRYCSGHRICFTLPEIQEGFVRYCAVVGVSEYYGNATVD